MDAFPLLRTKAVAQYPSTREVSIRCQVYTYVDGSEQRLRDSGAPLRRWTIRLDRISHAEAAAIGDFFRKQRGRAGTFLFVDPWTDAAHTVCFEDDTLQSAYTDEDASRIELNLREVKV